MALSQVDIARNRRVESTPFGAEVDTRAVVGNRDGCRRAGDIPKRTQAIEMNWRRASYICLRAAGGIASVAALYGCAMIPPKSFLDPTKVGNFPSDYQEGGIRRVLTPRESPEGIANATEPTPEDLIPLLEEYRFSKLDQIAVSIEDLLSAGALFQASREIDSTGSIRIPILGDVPAVGRTERELERDIADRLKERQLLPDPVVQVFAAVRRQQFFSVLGGVRQAGPVALSQPDLRLLEALALVGDTTPDVKKMYIIRRTEHSGASPTSTAPSQELVVPPPDIDGVAPSMYMQASDAQTTQPNEFDEVMSPGDRKTTSEPTSPPGAMPGDRPFAPIVFDPATGKSRETTPPEVTPTPTQNQTNSRIEEYNEPFDWEAVPETELSQRVIEIDVRALRAGDPRQNVVIRNQDVLVVPVDTGVFYVMGEVARPGVYGFGGREITIKQAIATVGNLTPLAWPSRCEIVRREPGTDKQITIPVNLDRIFAGLEDDVLLKDADILNVGTDIVAPFLFVIRNSFRFTYGFGFVYDRNFADQDAVGGKPNPESLAQQRRQQRGLPF